MVNEHGFYVPVMDYHGFDWEHGNYSSRIPEASRVDSIQRDLQEAMREYGRKHAAHDDAETISS
jgi:hypothetical protein